MGRDACRRIPWEEWRRHLLDRCSGLDLGASWSWVKADTQEDKWNRRVKKDWVRGESRRPFRGTEERGGGRPARPAGVQHRGQRRPLVDVAPHAPLSLNFTAETPEEKMIESGVGSSPHPRFKTYGFKRISGQARDYYCHRDPFPGSQR